MRLLALIEGENPPWWVYLLAALAFFLSAGLAGPSDMKTRADEHAPLIDQASREADR